MPDGSWLKSSLSFSNSNCVEVRLHGGVVEVRNSKDPDGAVLRFDRGEWQSFLVFAREMRAAPR